MNKLNEFDSLIKELNDHTVDNWKMFNRGDHIIGPYPSARIKYCITSRHWSVIFDNISDKNRNDFTSLKDAVKYFTETYIN